jgi:lipoyl(octanoyl) transferase
LSIKKNKEVVFQDLGLIDYQEAWNYQERLFRQVVDLKVANRKRADPHPTPNYLLFCQHPHVYTLGKSGNIDHLLLSKKELLENQATFYRINRGGDITYHGPGQIVGYLILDLDNFFTDIHLYLRTIEEAVIQTLADYQVDAGRVDGLTGVWLDYQQETRNFPRKICALGVKTSRWVTMHGFAFNVNTDLGYFDHIVPCGIQDKAVTSLSKELNAPVDLDKVSKRLRNHIARQFYMNLKFPNI